MFFAAASNIVCSGDTAGIVIGAAGGFDPGDTSVSVPIDAGDDVNCVFTNTEGASLDIDKVVHFASGEVLAEVSRANGGLVERDMRFAKRARDVLREIPIKDLLQMVKKAADLYTVELYLVVVTEATRSPEQWRTHLRQAWRTPAHTPDG